jgi:hypothetical protein
MLVFAQLDCGYENRFPGKPQAGSLYHEKKTGGAALFT